MTESSRDTEQIVGIDLGTTYSEVAAFVGGKMKVLGPGDRKMLPSVVGLSPSGELLVGESARNQLVVYPERTIKSIKRKMGTGERVALGDRSFTPPEVSSLILRELAEWARRDLGRPVRRAVITVPAYFSDAQRSATREAGALAGLEVVRILNEPTAASLAYGASSDKRRTVMVYDLGGGTFDCSIVTMEGDVTEVLASHGNNHLGGDDFDKLVLERLLRAFRETHGVDLQGDEHRLAYARLWWAAEEAKRRLSFEPYTRVREENLATALGTPLHLDFELAREEYETMIRSLVESTLESVTKALADANKKPSELDAVLLVGGATRTPLVQRVLEERCGQAPRQDVHPDLAVALGAGLLASRLEGHEVDRVLVDVSPYSFGPSYLDERDGFEYPYCYKPIIRRNTPLPVTRTESYYTSVPFQTTVEIEVFQGDDPDAMHNVPVGQFRVEDLKPTQDANEVLCRMSLDLDGILHVTAIEKLTGKSKHVAIDNALKAKSDSEIAELRRRMEELYSSRAAGVEEPAGVAPEGEWDEELETEEAEETSTAETAELVTSETPGDPAWIVAVDEAHRLVDRARAVLAKIHDEDREEVVDLDERIEQAIEQQDPARLAQARSQLQELLFFIEGK